jgi:hypothetical protein
MHQSQIIIRSKDGELLYDEHQTAPASWSEMTRKHLLLWASALGSTLPANDAKLILTAMFYGIPKEYFICIKRSAFKRHIRSLAYLFKRNLLSQWLIPSIWCGLFKYHGPKSQLANLTIHEFDRCEYCYERFDQTKNIAYLETLAAILYRPCRFFNIDDDIRVRLTTHGYIKRAKRFKKLPAGLKYAIYLNYEGCRNALHDRYKDVFTTSTAKGKIKQVEITPWPKIMESGSNDIFGPHSSTKQTNLHDFLSRLGTRIVDAKEMEKSLKK